ncbi:MAG: PAC2 family protein [Acidimicrobiales bacterium]|nr:PAC2 family protein [Acidimicrobiales bacterium]
MTNLSWHEYPDLHRPVLLVAFAGLFDGGQSATGAIHHLAERWPVHPVADLDPEPFFDFTQERPVISFDDAGKRTLTWPQNNFVAVRPHGAGAGSRDLVLLAGIEPHLRWRSFAEAIADVAQRCQAELVITLGAAPGRQPHDRPFQITASTSNPELARRLGVGGPSYQGPTGVIGVLNETLDQRNQAVIALRTAVPPYVLGAPNPKGRQALLRRLGNLLAIDTGHELLAAEADSWEAEVQQAVDDDPEAQRFVEQLAADFDTTQPSVTEADIDADELADQVERFLREIGDAGDSDEPD